MSVIPWGRDQLGVCKYRGLYIFFFLRKAFVYLPISRLVHIYPVNHGASLFCKHGELWFEFFCFGSVSLYFSGNASFGPFWGGGYHVSLILTVNDLLKKLALGETSQFQNAAVTGAQGSSA